MFDPSSRYYPLPTATLTRRDADGKEHEVRYVRRRFLPPLSASTLLLEHRFTQGERLDNLTARYLGDPAQFWRVCDANAVLQPEELEEVGRLIRVAMPEV
jgi:hypothetical protein